MRYNFNQKEIKLILDNLTICVDSREKSNQHIIDFFNKKKIPYKVMKLPLGDYSIMLPKGSFEGQERDIYFTNDFVVERKASIDEICGNLKDDAARLKKELAHLNKHDIEFYIFLEDENYEINLRNSNYGSQYDAFTLMQRIYKGIEAEYNTMVIPVPKSCMGSKIYYFLQARVYNLLKHVGYILESEVKDID